jgi:hypothetical protein
VLIRVCVGWAPLHQALTMYWRIRDLWGPANLVASTVTELDNTLPCFADVQWNSVQATHGVPIEVFEWKTTLGWDRTQSRLFDSHRQRWPLAVPSWLMCVMLSGYFSHARWPLIWISATPSDMGDIMVVLSLLGWCRDGNDIMVVLSLLGWCWLLCSHGILLNQFLLVLPLHA